MRGAAMSLLYILLLTVVVTVHGAPAGNAFPGDEDADQRSGNSAGGFKHSPIQTTVVNLNDSRTDSLFRTTFNVSKDEIYRRIAQRTSSETLAGNSGATDAAKRNDEEK